MKHAYRFAFWEHNELSKFIHKNWNCMEPTLRKNEVIWLKMLFDHNLDGNFHHPPVFRIY